MFYKKNSNRPIFAAFLLSEPDSIFYERVRMPNEFLCGLVEKSDHAQPDPPWLGTDEVPASSPDKTLVFLSGVIRCSLLFRPH